MTGFSSKSGLYIELIRRASVHFLDSYIAGNSSVVSDLGHQNMQQQHHHHQQQQQGQSMTRQKQD